ncbi:unannotated protein [freshwater metagenome]|uniref:Unannotated protein n=1 Tax=freshwater metagenome TaxID=449393 RepID=A0A6J6LHA4_9ZZZZ
MYAKDLDEKTQAQGDAQILRSPFGATGQAGMNS